MESRYKVIKILNYLFWILISIIFIVNLYNLFEPKILNSLSDKKIILDDNILNELTECTDIYINLIKNKQYINANKVNYFLNEKTSQEYEEIYNKIIKIPNYKIMIKEIYLLNDETYRCYYLIKDKSDNDVKNFDKVDKNLMNVITIKLNTKKNTFSILYDLFK